MNPFFWPISVQPGHVTAGTQAERDRADDLDERRHAPHGGELSLRIDEAVREVEVRDVARAREADIA
jgi:hypothetical protein